VTPQNLDVMTNVRKLIEAVDVSQSHADLLHRPHGAAGLLEANMGKEPIKLNLHINNYGIELGRLRQNQNFLGDGLSLDKDSSTNDEEMRRHLVNQVNKYTIRHQARNNKGQ
jgi:hypothetical protein